MAGQRFGALVSDDGVRFSVWSQSASQIWVSIFEDDGHREVARMALSPEGEGVHALFVPGLTAGTRYGFRADGPYDPANGLWFDPAKLLTDPYAVEIDRPYVYDPRLAAARADAVDTAQLMPRAIVKSLPEVTHATPLFAPGGLIYEVPVRAFTMLHPAVPETSRGTIGALAHPAIIEHLLKLNVSAVELMPVTAWIDERHLPPLGLTNSWGYNPVSFMALDPRLAPGGMAELRAMVAALRAVGIGVILDVVFNHTGESDALGPTLSLRGLDSRAYFGHMPDGRLVNDTGTGNTLACDHSMVRELVLDSLRHFVRHAGVDGFRFDLAPVLGRGEGGFNPGAPLIAAITADAELADRVLIAEPWDIGPDGYQLGNFPPPFLEWNDRYRDDVRRFWRGDRSTVGALATRLAGSSDIFGGGDKTRSVDFIAAHDGMTLADLTAYERKHNEANGEQNRDGHNENFSWNNGVEGFSADPELVEKRRGDAIALLSTLFASRGTIMLTAGDEFGRTQRGNNNAYAQDNAVTWLDWAGRDLALEDHVAALSAMRKAVPALRESAFLTGQALLGSAVADVEWLAESGLPLGEADWNDPDRHRLAMLLAGGDGGRIAVLINGDRDATGFSLPAREGFSWASAAGLPDTAWSEPVLLAGRTVVFAVEQKSVKQRA